MKCVKRADDSIVRITDAQAHQMVRAGSGQYVPRKTWKAETRDKDKDKSEVE